MANGAISDNVGKLSSGSVLFVEWKIEDFLALPDEVDYHIKSPTFHFDGAKWYLCLYPNGQTDKDSAGYVDIYLVMHNSAVSQMHRVNYHLGISGSDGDVYASYRSENVYEDVGHSGALKLISQVATYCSEDISEIAPNGVVTVFCYLQVKSGRNSEVSTQPGLDDGAHKLAKNLKDLLLRKEECDITLKVMDEEFQAHKAILVARSSVFCSMFRHEMTEKLSREVNIPDCDPDAFQLFLIYLYTGTIEGLSSENVFNMYAIANKYDANELKINCTEYMRSNLSVETVCECNSPLFVAQ